MVVGFGVGDFIAVAKLIDSIVSILKRSADAPSEYLGLERELSDLQKALNEIECLHVEQSQQAAANALKCAALNCQQGLEEFYSKLTKYQSSFGNGSDTSRRFKIMGRKLQWGLSMAEEVTKLRVYIAAHVGSLNMRLLTLGLESTTVLSTRVQDTHSENQHGSAEILSSLSGMQKQQAIQDLMLQRILDIVSTTLEPHLNFLVDMSKKVWDSNVKATAMLEELGSGSHPPDLRHTWLQDPIRLEDPFGGYITIPSEYSFDMMEAVILARCKSGPGSRRIQMKEFEITNSRNSKQVFTQDRFTRFIPGMQLRMAILLYDLIAETNKCPIPTCGSRMLSECRAGGKICVACNVWFNLGSSKRRRVYEIDSDAEDSTDVEKRKRSKINPQFISRMELDEEDDFSLFKNIQLPTQVLVGSSKTKSWRTFQSTAPAPSPNRPLSSYSFSESISEVSPVTDIPEDWTEVSDLFERRRIQNLIAQRNYRKKLKRRLAELERNAKPTAISSRQTSVDDQPSSLKAFRGLNARLIEAKPDISLDVSPSYLHRNEDLTPGAGSTLGKRRKKTRIRPPQGDTVLISYLAANNPYIAEEVAKRALDDETYESSDDN